MVFRRCLPSSRHFLRQISPALIPGDGWRKCPRIQRRMMRRKWSSCSGARRISWTAWRERVFGLSCQFYQETSSSRKNAGHFALLLFLFFFEHLLSFFLPWIFYLDMSHRKYSKVLSFYRMWMHEILHIEDSPLTDLTHVCEILENLMTNSSLQWQTIHSES